MPKWKTLLWLFALMFGGVSLYFFNEYTKTLHWDYDLYARNFFSVDGIQVSRVIGSKQFHSSTDDLFACSFAIVELKPESTAALVASISNPEEESSGKSYKFDEHRQGAYGQFIIRDWPATPVSREKTNQMCSEIPRECCLKELKPADAAIIMKGLDAPGGWAARGLEVTNFFLPEQNIIGTIRFGD